MNEEDRGTSTSGEAEVLGSLRMLRGAYGQRDTFARHTDASREYFTDTQKTKWLFISAPMPVFFISIVYLYIVYIAGPQFMKNRQPYSLKIFMQCYNLFQIISNAWITFNYMTYGRPLTVIWRFCGSLDELCGNYSEKVLETTWWVLMLKLFDLIETVMFVLRKKNHQVSFLHTYHHVTTFIYLWLVLSYFSHSFLIISISLNCSVHVVMYSYYFLSTFGSNMQRILLPIKKSITTLQMGHITFIMIVAMQGFIPNCGTKMLKVDFSNKAMRTILNQQTPRTIVLHSVEIQAAVQGAENVVSPRPPVRRIERLQSRGFYATASLAEKQMSGCWPQRRR
ncbi:Elongation of very long chain fatty acids protein 4 [Acromyrmex echinatior]|uniref:Elongation of very long chain fatty acids protein n=1 Tax=Acromyrmex echinatior TaxID=103372 RepID=F4X8L4_ACREC|nr:Elongation of very long chain fatty acids protein 4 [Acromyrmex echinatior]